MLKYILKRVLSMLITLIIIITLVFFIIRLVPGDPLSSMARNLPDQVKANFYAKYGLDQPLIIQYFRYMKNLIFRFDMGVSLVFMGRNVKDMIMEAAPISAKINLRALAFGVSTGMVLGITAAYKRNKWPDFLVMFLAILGISIPSFVLATTLQYFFTVKHMLLPTIGWTNGDGQFKYTILPMLALCLNSIAIYARYLRASVLDVLGQDYILTAKAKGVTGFALTWRHVIRNAILPAITILGPQIAGVFIGSFVIESIFGIPGFGQIYVSAINNRDFTMILGQTIMLNTFYIISLLAVDILYGLVDPRIRVFKGRK
ncbi:MAG: ABC transporter permease [Fusobacteriaceae bacterium]